MKLNHLIYLTFLAGGFISLNVLKENTIIEITALPAHDTVFNGVVALLGSGTEKDQSKASFSVNVGLQTSIVGNKDKAKWGISCDASVDNSCAVTDTSERSIFYFSKMLTVQKAELYLRLDQANKLDVVNPKVDKIAVDLVVGGNSWILNDWGILGLSPAGSFAKFFTQVYGDKAIVLLQYAADNLKVPNDKLTFDFKAYLNPNYNATSVVKEFQLDEKAVNWYGIVDIDFIAPEWGFSQKKVCFSTIVDEIIEVVDRTDRCNAVKKIICDGKIGSDCTRANAVFSKAPKLVLNFSGTNFEFTPEEYIFYDGDKVDCRFGHVEKLRANGSCEEDTEIAVGKLFYQKYIPVLKFNYGSKATITFLSEFKGPDVKPVSRLLWIIIGGIAAVLALIVIISVILKKKQESDDDYYPSYQNAGD